jgi:hypothetical protein
MHDAQACGKRIAVSKEGDCEPWYFDYMKCIDSCVSSARASAIDNGCDQLCPSVTLSILTEITRVSNYYIESASIEEIPEIS